MISGRLQLNNPVLEQLKKPDVKIAIIGATNDTTKYGNTIYRDLKKKGYSVYGINHKATTIDSDPAYKDLSSLGFKPDILNFVVPPKIGFEIIKEAVKNNYDNFWLQPGAESYEIIEFLENSKKNYLANACVMVETRNV
jgi:predicted CoA-binding protein